VFLQLIRFIDKCIDGNRLAVKGLINV